MDKSISGKSIVEGIDSIYNMLVKNNLKGEGAKNKLIEVYENMLIFNLELVKSLLDGECEMDNILSLYCDMCYSLRYIVDYYRNDKNGNPLSISEIVDSFDKKSIRLNDKIEDLEKEIYSRDIKIKELETDIDNISCEKIVRHDMINEFRNKRKIERDNVEISRKKIKEQSIKIKELEYKIADMEDYKANKLKNHLSDNPAKRIDVDDDVVLKLYLDGKTPNQIGKMFNMSQSAIIYRIKKIDNGKHYKIGGRHNKIKKEK